MARKSKKNKSQSKKSTQSKRLKLTQPKKLSKFQSKTYKIIENNYEPYLVKVNKNEINIYSDPKHNFNSQKDYTKLNCKISDYKKVFVSGEGDTLSLLVECLEDNKYIFIGSVIYSFNIDEKINDYRYSLSPIAIGKKFNYRLLPNNVLIQNKKDSNKQYKTVDFIRRKDISN